MPLASIQICHSKLTLKVIKQLNAHTKRAKRKHADLQNSRPSQTLGPDKKGHNIV